jgi:glutaredoxin
MHPSSACSQPKSARQLLRLAALGCLTLGLFISWPAIAQYKVVQPDGSITYTDRPQLTGPARVIPVSPSNRAAPVAAAAAAGNDLPLELRQAAQRYPVTLYTAKDCPACETGRRFLQARGVPYAEKVVSTEDDAAEMERVAGGRSVPTLTIGPQPLRGLSEGDWTAYLDAAGYPRESKLPRNWPKPLATPVVERNTAVSERVAPVAITPSAPVTPPPADPVNNPTGIRF